MTSTLITKEQLAFDMRQTLSSFKSRYPTSTLANDAFANYNYSGLNLDSNISSHLRQSAKTQNIAGRLYTNYGDEAKSFVRGITIDMGEYALKSQKSLGVSFALEIKRIVAQGYTVEQAFALFGRNGNLQAYINKTTSVIVYSERVLSATTHIPVGKFLTTAGKMAGGVGLGFAFEGTLESIWNGWNGNGSAKDFLKNYTVDSFGLVAGVWAAGLITAGPITAILVGAAGGALAAFVAKEVIESLPAMIDAGKAAGKTLAQVYQEVQALIAVEIEKAYNATGAKANELLDQMSDFISNISDTTAELANDLNMAMMDAHSFTPPAWLKTITDMITAARTEASPLILDLDGDGIEVSALNSTGSVYWDVDNDGFREASSWVGKDDGLLALDINKNGVIDNHSELFGTLKTDGFTVLTGLDSNQNGMIDSGDTRFQDLRVWIDANSDGISQIAIVANDNFNTFLNKKLAS
jgi:hypothetical protein